MHSLPERKRVRLKGYDYSTPGAYFITVCTHGRKQLLSNIVVGAIHESPAPSIHESPTHPIHEPPTRLIPENRLTQYGEITKQIIEMLPGRFNISIPKYVIMPNHIHLIIEIGCDLVGAIHESPACPIHESQKNGCNISRAIRESPLRQMERHRSIIDKTVGFMKMNISKAINATYNEKIWQRSYHDHIIRDEKDYQKIWEYIDTNTARWADDCFYDSANNNTIL